MQRHCVYQRQIQKINVGIEITNKGLPAYWERGGMDNDGCGIAVVIGNHMGAAKRPIFIRSKGELACKEHALFVIKPGDIIVEAFVDHRRVVSVIMYRVDSIDRDNASAMLNVINEFTGNIWTEAVPESLDAIITTAIEKSMTHHCRTPCYVALA